MLRDLINTENAQFHVVYVFVRLGYSVNFAYHPTKPETSKLSS